MFEYLLIIMTFITLSYQDLLERVFSLDEDWHNRQGCGGVFQLVNTQDSYQECQGVITDSTEESF